MESGVPIPPSALLLLYNQTAFDLHNKTPQEKLSRRGTKFLTGRAETGADPTYRMYCM